MIAMGLRRLRDATLALYVGLAAFPAAAEGFTPIEARLATRILLFQVDPPMGERNVAILYDPDSTASAAEAAETARSMRQAEPTGSLRLVPVLVPVTEVESVRDVVALMISDSVIDRAQNIAQVARRLRVPTLSRSLECVADRQCVVTVQSRPKVRITLSRDAADGAQVAFQPAVWLMVEAMP